ncbi:MAG: ABC transporter permease [Deltaproteobacteria bacterium]|nr:ABC transporter permease [Deltaproteobacteria bacterium]MBW2116545.1 ABC transporter permease [Deltaproteobacteria bacterium]
MRFRLWPYFFRQAFTNILNNRIFHAIGLSTMVVSLLIFGTFLILFVNLSAWLEGWGHSLTISVYLKDGISETKKDEIASIIRKLEGAEIKRFISKDGALKDLKKALGSHAVLLEDLSVNPLPASFEVIFKVRDGQETDPFKIKNELESIEGVDEVQYSEEWLKRFKGLMNMVRLIGFIIGGLLCMGILFIVTNTIKLTIYSRREEIEILKLVGATDWFVKAPFLLEGLIQGVLSGIVALLVLFSGYLLLSAKKLHFLGLAVLDFVFLPNEYVFSILFISVALGLIGSFIAVGRFFDV